VLWITTGLVLLLILFPPHKAPKGYPLEEGRHTMPIFMPPEVVVDASERSVGALEVSHIDENNMAHAKMRINSLRLALECLAVIVVGGAVFGFLAARSAAAEVPDPKPVDPKRRTA